jgi:hypothetical protein
VFSLCPIIDPQAREVHSRDCMRHLVFAVATLVLPATSACTDSGNEPQCAQPAPLSGRRNPDAPDLIVLLHEGVDATMESERLGDIYDFTAQHVYTTLPGFSALIDEGNLPMFRCEPSVSAIERDAVIGTFSMNH